VTKRAKWGREAQPLDFLRDKSHESATLYSEVPVATTRRKSYPPVAKKNDARTRRYGGRRPELDVDYSSYLSELAEATFPDGTPVFALSLQDDVGGGIKLGINPQASYETTPLGLYAYPLTPEIAKLAQVGGLPYRGEAKNYFVLRRAEPERALVFSADTLRENSKIRRDYDRDKKATTSVAAFNVRIRQRGFTSILDLGTGTVHSNEPWQVVFLSPKSYKVETVLPRDKVRVDVNLGKFTSALLSRRRAENLYRRWREVRYETRQPTDAFSFWHDLMGTAVEGAAAFIFNNDAQIEDEWGLDEKLPLPFLVFSYLNTEEPQKAEEHAQSLSMSHDLRSFLLTRLGPSFGPADLLALPYRDWNLPKKIRLELLRRLFKPHARKIDVRVHKQMGIPAPVRSLYYTEQLEFLLKNAKKLSRDFPEYTARMRLAYAWFFERTATKAEEKKYGDRMKESIEALKKFRQDLHAASERMQSDYARPEDKGWLLDDLDLVERHARLLRFLRVADLSETSAPIK
jgi:hypothetical protein